MKPKRKPRPKVFTGKAWIVLKDDNTIALNWSDKPALMNKLDALQGEKTGVVVREVRYRIEVIGDTP